MLILFLINLAKIFGVFLGTAAIFATVGLIISSVEDKYGPMGAVVVVFFIVAVVLAAALTFIP